jgi:hypothetical protein
MTGGTSTGGPILCSMDQTGWTNQRGEIVPVKLREEAVIVVHDQLTWVYAERIGVITVEHRVAKGLHRYHCFFLLEWLMATTLYVCEIQRFPFR